MDAHLSQTNSAQELSMGSGHTMLIDKLCAVLLCLAPMLQQYVGVYENMGFTVLLVVAPILLFRLIAAFHADSINITCVLAVVPLLLYQIYALMRQDFSVGQIIYRAFMLFVILGISTGAVNLKLVMKYATVIGAIGAVSIIVQFVLYHLLGYHLKMIPTQFLIDERGMWMERVTFGTKNGDIYRPSGIFLEPSHFFLYTFPLLAMLLLMPKMNKSRLFTALLLSVASVCSTSGMGIVVTCGLWAVYYLLYKRRETETFNLSQVLNARTILLVSAFAVAAIVAYFKVPVVQSAVNRILADDSGKSVAISGRVDRANLLLQKMTVPELFFGDFHVADSLDFNLPGFHSTLYRFGIIGLVLTYVFYGQGLLRLKGSYFYITGIILVVSFFSAHTHGTFYMLFYAMFLVNGYYERSIPSSMRGATWETD